MERVKEETAAARRTHDEPATDQRTRADALLELQRSHGNQAVQRFVRGLRPASSPVLQRKVVVTPAAYAAGLGTTAPNFTMPQFTEYMRMAILDEYDHIKRHAMANDYDAYEAMEGHYVIAGSSRSTMANRIPALNSLITAMNTYQDTKMGKTDTKNDVVPPNRDTRYASEPKEGYSHGRSGAAVSWKDDPDMWKQFGTAFAVQQPNLATVAPRGKDGQKVLSVLPWSTAKAMLPAPLLKLIFDVRFQLEAGALGVVDERTADQRQRKVMSPNEPGTLRSWHQDSPQVLPPNTFSQGVPQGQPAALHAHYQATSQTGAGSSIQKGRSGAEGYAEYTGTGSNWEHNTKVVLDYTQKKVYLTLSHYMYWALIATTTGGHFMKVGNSQDAGQSTIVVEDYIKEEKKKSSNTLTDTFVLFSPWLEVQTA
jgi:hypothetical protein